MPVNEACVAPNCIHINRILMTFLVHFIQVGEGPPLSKQPAPPSSSEESLQPSADSTVRGEAFCINAKVIVYAALSGMVSFLSDGTIYGCNHHFAVMLFGYQQEELLKKV